MPSLLQVRPFTADLLEEVQAFDCGATPWERDVSDWLKNRSRGLRMITRGRCHVWLYYTEVGELVGYGSLGPYDWEWPDLNSPPRTTTHIPYMGVASAYKGEPADAEPAWRYASQIMRHLIGQAVIETQQNPSRVPILGLFVEPENQRAVRFYERLGFLPYEKRFVDPPTGIEYVAMFTRLSTLV